MRRLRVAYLALEPYRERYTSWLTEWTTRQWAAAGFDVDVYEGDGEGERTIGRGEVLDRVGRGAWSCRQVAALLPRIEEYDAVYLADLFTPGAEALFYAAHPRGRPAFYARNWAQTFDPHDFTFEMRGWMRRYEEMVHARCAATFVASACHAAAVRAGDVAAPPCHAVGLPYDADHVRGLPRGAPEEGDYVVFSSRLDAEKDPLLMLAVARRLAGRGLRVVVCSGADDLRSNDDDCLAAVRRAAAEGVVVARVGLSKADYLGVLAGARAHLLTSRQDFVSFAMLDASALGVPSVAPATPSFVEELSPARLYVPGDVDGAAAAVCAAAFARDDPRVPPATVAAERHSRTLAREACVIAARGASPRPIRQPEASARVTRRL